MSEMIDLLIDCHLLDSCWPHEFVSSKVSKLLLKRNKMNFLFVMLPLLRIFVATFLWTLVYSFANDVCDSAIIKKNERKRMTIKIGSIITIFSLNKTTTSER